MEPIEKVPAYVQVVERIRRAIHLGQYVPGDRLPSEVDLSQQLGVSRVTLREAIRHLEGQGYVKITRGARGGTFVTDEPQTQQSRLASLRDQSEEIESLFDFRRAVEPAAASLAARRRSKRDLERMAEAIEALRQSDNVPAFRKADSEFHLAVAEAAANRYLSEAVEVARAGMFLPLDATDFTVTRSSSSGEHEEIYQAIKERNGEKAADRMAQHVETAHKEIHEVIWGEKTRETN